MNWFIENCTPADIGIALALAVIAVGCIRFFLWKLDELDRQWAADTAMDNSMPMIAGSLDGHTCCIVDDMTAQDLADLQRGKLP